MPPAPMNDSIQVLLVEDNAGDARLVLEYLKDSGVAEFTLQTADRLSAALKFLAGNRVDIILLDLGLPDSHGVETLRQVRAQVATTPVIVVTGLDDREMGLEALRNGAQDYLVKSRVDGYLLGRAILRQLDRAAANQQASASPARPKP